MSQENVEIVRSIYDAWARNDFPGPAHLLDQQIVYVNPPEAIEPGIRRGLPAFSQAVEQVFHEGGWESWVIDPERFTPVGDRVAVELRYRARGRGSGVEMEGRMSALWTVRDGKVVRFEWFLAPTGALEAAGLPE
jgi:ketosteroid isomerase-like protein